MPDIEQLAVEVQRCQSMIQEVSVSVDINRREIQVAVKRCHDLAVQLELAVQRVERLHGG